MKKAVKSTKIGKKFDENPEKNEKSMKNEKR